MNQLPETGFLRLSQIIGNPKATPPVPPIIPIGKTSWWAGVKTGRFPKPVKLGPRITVWRVEDIRALIDSASEAVINQNKNRIPASPAERKRW